jgi:hypothetical protein
MDRLKECAEVFSGLLDTKYILKLGRKNVLTELELVFDKKDFYHLIGLQKLVDISNLKKDRGIIFDEIMRGNITYEMIQSSAYFRENQAKNIIGIEKRIDVFIFFEKLLDSPHSVFKYNNKAQQTSKIHAEFLLESREFLPDILYLFLDKFPNADLRYCKSFFPKTKKDYTIRQTSMTLLYKEKVHIGTGKSNIQLDRLTLVCDNVNADL